MTAPPIIQYRRITISVPPQVRRGRHAVAAHPSAVTIVSRQAAVWFAIRFREANLDVVRARVARWSVIAVPAAVYVAVVLASIGGR
jgi:uncharacterized RmlC-like cupin family protein